jgi:cytohesin
MDAAKEWQLATEIMSQGIAECSDLYEDSPNIAYEMIREAASVFSEQLSNRPVMLGQVLGEYLHRAVMKDKGDAVTLLAELGANPDWREFDKASNASIRKTPLQWVASNGDDEEWMINILVAAGAQLDSGTKVKMDESPLILAVREGKSTKIATLLEHGANPNARAEQNHETALHILTNTKVATTKVASQVQMIKELLDAGADPLAKDGNGFTPLFRAIEHGSIASVNALLETGKYNKQFLDVGLIVVAQRGHLSEAVEIVDTLVKHGANIRCSYEGRTPLEYAQNSMNTPGKEALVRHITSLTMASNIDSAMTTTGEPNSGKQKSSKPKSSGTPSL